MQNVISDALILTRGLQDNNELQVRSGITLTADSTTAQLACCNRGVTLSTMFSASRASAALYLERASSIKT
jgi:hypothetical protein